MRERFKNSDISIEKQTTTAIRNADESADRTITALIRNTNLTDEQILMKCYPSKEPTRPTERRAAFLKKVCEIRAEIEGFE